MPKITPVLPKIQNITPKYKVTKELGLEYNPDLVERIGYGGVKTADVVTIEKIDNPQDKTIITTFRDALNNVVERVYQYTAHNKPDVHRLYTPLESYGNPSIKGRLVQVRENLDITGKYKVWKKVNSEKQYVTYNAQNEPTNVTIAKVTTNERFMNPTKKEEHSLTEYFVPKAHGGKKEPRYIKMSTDKKDTDIPEILDIETSKGVKIPVNDEFLCMRMYDAEDIRTPIARVALKRKGLGDVRIGINEDFSMDKKTHGHFNPQLGVLSYNYRIFPKKDVVNTGYHESEHAYQYAIEALAGYSNTKYAGQCRRAARINMTPELEAKGGQYHIANFNYVSPEKDYQAYRKNLLEEEAWEAGRLGQENYQAKAAELSKEFPGIPIEEL